MIWLHLTAINVERSEQDTFLARGDLQLITSLYWSHPSLNNTKSSCVGTLQQVGRITGISAHLYLYFFVSVGEL